MRCVDILASFELEINKLNDALDKPVTDDSLYWINQAIVKFVKDRFNGNAPKRTSYEQNEKRTRDLIRLLKESTVVIAENTNLFKEEDVYSPKDTQFENLDQDIYTNWNEVYEYESSNQEYVKESDVIYETASEPKNDQVLFVGINLKHRSYGEYEFLYPSNMMFVLNEDVIISDTNNENLMDTCVFECTADNFMYRVNNKLTDFHYRFHRARPLRIRTKDGFKLLTDKKYKIYSYTLGYLKEPDEITNTDPYKDYTDFEDYTWLEIVKIAAQMYIENQSDPRYKTITNEVLTQE